MKSFMFFAFNFVVIIFSILEKVLEFGWIPEDYSKWIIFISGILFAISLCIFLWTLRQKIIHTISSEYKKIEDSISFSYRTIHETISSIKGVLPNGQETDVARKLLKMQLGEIAEKILPSDTSFPVTLVPGGDAALIMNQSEYGKIIRNVIQDIAKCNKDYEVLWTTFVPFESLSSMNSNEFFDYVSIWAKLNDKGKQIIILELSNDEHPLYFSKYSNSGTHNPELIKYLCVRYEVETHRDDFNTMTKNNFLNGNLKNKIKQADMDNKRVKWISLANTKSFIQDKKIHNIDFIYFKKPGNDFAFVRIDADNRFNIDIGGVVGVTFVIYTSDNLKLYSDIFNKMWNHNEAKQTFYELTGKEIYES